MHSATGKISAIEAAGDERVAIVEVDVSAVCRRCAEGRGCGAGIFSGAGRTRSISIQLGESAAPQNGASVCIGIPSGSLLCAAAIVYGAPLAGAIAGGLIAQVAATSESWAVAWVATGLVLGIAVARHLIRGQKFRQRVAPVLRA